MTPEAFLALYQRRRCSGKYTQLFREPAWSLLDNVAEEVRQAVVIKDTVMGKKLITTRVPGSEEPLWLLWNTALRGLHDTATAEEYCATRNLSLAMQPSGSGSRPSRTKGLREA